MIYIKLEKLNEIIQFVNTKEDWSDFKKARYVFVQLGRLYEYDPKYNYADEEEQFDILANGAQYTDLVIKFIANPENMSDKEKEIAKIILEDENKICVSLAPIYYAILKKLELADVKISSGNVIIRYCDKNYRRKEITTDIAKGLLSCKIMSIPEGFGNEAIYEELEKTDRELGFIDDSGYKEIKSSKLTDELKNEETLDSKLRKFFKIQINYVENVIGKKLKGVQFHKFYKYFLLTSFSESKVQIFPLHDDKIENIKYVVIAKSEEKTGSYLYFLYDEQKNKFVEKTEEQMKIITLTHTSDKYENRNEILK